MNINNFLQKNETILCDIREPDEHNRERIAEAVNTPLSSFHHDDLYKIAKDKVLVFIVNQETERR